MINTRHSSYQNKDIEDAVYTHAIKPYIYPLGQHKAAQMHATAIQAMGGIAHVRIDEENFSIELTTDFEKEASHSPYIFNAAQTLREDIRGLVKRPPSPTVKTLSLLIMAGIGSCSYNVAPKSTSEVVGWGTLFAAWGAATIFNSAHRKIIGRPNEQKMVETALHIKSLNQEIIEDWRIDNILSQPR